MGEEFEMVESEWSGSDNGDGPRTFSIIPDGKILEAEVVSVKKGTKPWKDDNGNPIVKVEFEFRVVDQEFNGRRVWGDTPTTFSTHPDCKLRAWVQEILGLQELTKGFKFNTDNVVGLRCRIVIAVSEWKDKNTGEDKKRNSVGDVIRSRDSETAMASVGASLGGTVVEDDLGDEPF